MLDMDFTSKGITWVGNIYQKFETMCQDVYQEVDGIVIQEKAKYVESQVQTGCETVRKFCAEVMQDLFLPPDCSVKVPVSDSVKVPVSDLSLNYNADVEICKKTRKSFEECPLNEKTLPPTKPEAVVSSGNDSSQAQLNTVLKEANWREECGILSEKSVPTSTNLKNTECDHNRLKAVEVVSDISNSQPAHTSVLHPVVTSLQNEVENTPEQPGHITSTDVIGTNKLVEAFSKCHGNVHQKSQKTNSMEKSSVNGHDQQGEPATTATVYSSAEIGRLKDFDWEEASKNTDNVEASTDTEEEYEDLNLEASSIDAEARDQAHLFPCQDSGKRSYKKKLRDALSLKLRFAKKNDGHYQMATLSGEFNAGIEQKGLTPSSSTIIVDLDPRKSATQDSYESEWELL